MTQVETNKTRIMYGLGTDVGSLNRFLAELQRNGLLEYDDSKRRKPVGDWGRRYRTTKKGFQFLATYQKSLEYLGGHDYL